MLKRLSVVACLGLMACAHHVTLEQDHATKAAEANAALGLAYLRAGDYPRAKRKLLLGLQLAPYAAEPHAAFAYFLEKTGEKRQAAGYYQRALALAPHSGAQLNNNGAFLCRMGQHKEGLALLRKAMADTHYVHVAMAYENAGICAEMMGDSAMSMAYFSKALKHDPRLSFSLHEFVKLALQAHEPQRAYDKLKAYEAVHKGQ